MQKKRKKIKKSTIILNALFVAFLLLTAVVSQFLSWGSLLPAYPIAEIGEGEVRLHFLSVGQADCTIVEFDDGELFVIDAGGGSVFEQSNVIRYVKGLKPTRLNLILTQATSDHFGGFVGLLNAFRVDAFYFPMMSVSTPRYQTLLKKVQKEGCATETLSRYATIGRDDGYFVCLSPYSDGETSVEDSSTVLYFETQGIKTVFSADIGKDRERQLAREYLLGVESFTISPYEVRLEEVDILKVARHGAQSSSSEEWLNLLRPTEAVISCGAGNGGSSPRQSTIQTLFAVGAEIYRTDELGNIIISIKDGNYSVTRGES